MTATWPTGHMHTNTHTPIEMNRKLTTLFAAFSLAAFALPALAEDESIIIILDPENGTRYLRPTDGSKKMPAMQRIDAGLTPYIYEGGRISQRDDEVSTNVMSLHFIRQERLIKLKAGHGLAPNPAKIVADKK